MNTNLPADFLFSQSSLQDWTECRRRFQYRYLERLSYPAPMTADLHEFEEHTRNGEAFHKLAHQYLIGIAPELLERHIENDTVHDWWDHFLMNALDAVPEQRYPETILSAPLGDYRLIAKYDLVAMEPGQRAIIMDWKTSNHRPQQSRLERRLQTIVYRYVLVEAGTYYNGGKPVLPEQVEMVYWFANDSTKPIRLPYSQTQYEADKQFLHDLVSDIALTNDFPKVSEAEKDRVCRFCVYRSLCWQDVQAGAFADMVEDEVEDTPLDFDIDFDQIAEIEF